MKIRIHSEQSELNKSQKQLKKLSSWVCARLKLNISTLDIIFISSREFQRLHQDYLQDDTPGDVLTFNLSEDKKIEGEIYINLEQTRDQAVCYRVPVLDEIFRLIIHGCLHLAGFSDLHKDEQKVMKKKEEFLLKLGRKFYV
jgi:probable rRNA maturation factor